LAARFVHAFYLTENNMEAITLQKTDSVQSKQMWSLTALYASIVIGWIAYQQYQPKLLVQFQFTDFAFLLGVVQAIILTVTPLIAGKLGDRYRFKEGNRMPVISSGISFAAMVFMAVAFTLLGNPGEVFRWILPVLIVVWLIAMSIFTSPALSTIETFIPVEKLPRAMAILTIAANLLYSLEPVIVDIIDFIGAPATFMAGGAIVFISGYALKKNSLNLFSSTGGKEVMVEEEAEKQLRSNYVLIFILGSVLGIATTTLFNIFPDILQEKLADLLNEGSSKIISAGILMVSALLSIPFSHMASVYGLKRSFWTSGILTLISIAGVLLLQAPLAVLLMLVFFAIGFSALSVSSLPLAIRQANFYEKVFCVGIFFSGVEFWNGMVESYLLF
jgi:MFS family permease